MRTLVIAEAGVNHNGSLELATQLVDAAAAAGADCVKFQTFSAEKLVTRNATKASYQNRTTNRNESQYAMLKRLELDRAAHRHLRARCAARRIEFLSTPFDEPSLELLLTFGLRRIKIPSGELTNLPFLLRVAATGRPVILSTGMALLGEIEEALGAIAFGYLGRRNPCAASLRAAYRSAAGQKALRSKVSLLHCTTEYPAPINEINLRAMDTLAATFGLPVGYSDHTIGIVVPIAAVARGAVIIEKHFTLDRNSPGPDHKASLEPAELAEMVRAVRMVELAIGDGRKLPAPSEISNMAVARKSIVALMPIATGARFTRTNLGIKRPGTGVAPARYWELLNRKADRSYQKDDPIQW